MAPALPRRIPVALLVGTLLASVNCLSYAGGPWDHAAQKGANVCGKESCGKEGCWSLWCPHKPFLYHRMPPMLPVVQSQAVRSAPAEAEPLRMRLQVRTVEEEPSREQFRDSDPPRDPLRDRDRARDQFRDDGGPPYQKGQSTIQKSNYLTDDAERYDISERFLRLERQFELLLDKLDRLAEERGTTNSPAPPLRLPGSE